VEDFMAVFRETPSDAFVLRLILILMSLLGVVFLAFVFWKYFFVPNAQVWNSQALRLLCIALIFIFTGSIVLFLIKKLLKMFNL